MLIYDNLFCLENIENKNVKGVWGERTKKPIFERLDHTIIIKSRLQSFKPHPDSPLS